jgi:hypothetical protein
MTRAVTIVAAVTILAAVAWAWATQRRRYPLAPMPRPGGWAEVVPFSGYDQSRFDYGP